MTSIILSFSIKYVESIWELTVLLAQVPYLEFPRTETLPESMLSLALWFFVAFGLFWGFLTSGVGRILVP